MSEKIRYLEKTKVMKGAIDKLENYRELEAVFFSNTQSWSSVAGFGSAISRFVTKVARLDLFCSEGKDKDAEISLMSEIDDFLRYHIDAFVGKICPLSSDFCSNYRAVRSNG